MLSDTARRTNRRALALFIAATFGLMAVLSLPIAQFLPGPLRSVFGGLERILRPPIIVTAPARQPGLVTGTGPRAGSAGIPARPPAPLPPAGGGGGSGGGGSGGSGGNTSGGGSGPPPPVPAPVPPTVTGPAPGVGAQLKKEVSRLHIRTVHALRRIVGGLGPRRVRTELRPRSDQPSAVDQLILLTAQRRLSDIPSTVTRAELHWLLVDLRRTLPMLFEQAKATPPHPKPPEGRASRPAGSRPGRTANVATSSTATSSRGGRSTATPRGSKWWMARRLAAHAKQAHRHHRH